MTNFAERLPIFTPEGNFVRMIDRQSTPHTFDLNEVSARIPLLQKIGSDIIRVKNKRDDILKERQSESSPTSRYTGTVMKLQDELRVLSKKLESYREEIKELGGLLVNVDQVTMEFLGEIDGCLAWFSWQPGEDSIQAWRPVDGEPGERIPLIVNNKDLDTEDLIYPLD